MFFKPEAQADVEDIWAQCSAIFRLLAVLRITSLPWLMRSLVALSLAANFQNWRTTPLSMAWNMGMRKKVVGLHASVLSAFAALCHALMECSFTTV